MAVKACTDRIRYWFNRLKESANDADAARRKDALLPGCLFIYFTILIYNFWKCSKLFIAVYFSRGYSVYIWASHIRESVCKDGGVSHAGP